MRSWHGYKIVLFISLMIIGHFSTAACDDAPILIGATVSMEGKYQEPSKMIQESFRLWAKQVNQRSGILGRKVKMVLYDDKSQPSLVKHYYQKLIEEDNVDLVFSPYGTPLTLAASEISERHKFIMLACAAAGKSIWQKGYHYVFGMYAPADRMFIGLLDMMAGKGHKTLSLIYDATSSFNLDVVAGALEWADKFKINIVFQKGYQNGPLDLPGIVAGLKGTNADGAIVSAYPSDCYELLRILDENKYKPQILAMTIAPIHPDFEKNAGKVAEHVFGSSQWEPDERIPFPGTKRFISAFNASTGHMPSYHAGSAYAACQLYEHAIIQTNSLDNQKIRNYIAALDTVTVIGRFKVDPTGMQIGHNSIIIQWQHGKKEIVWPKKMQTAKPIL